MHNNMIQQSIHAHLVPKVDDKDKGALVDAMLQFKEGSAPSETIQSLEREGFISKIDSYDYEQNQRARDRITAIDSEMSGHRTRQEGAQAVLDEEANKTYLFGKLGKAVSELVMSEEKKQDRRRNLSGAEYTISDADQKIKRLELELRGFALIPDYSEAVACGGAHFLITESGKEFFEDMQYLSLRKTSAASYQDLLDGASYNEIAARLEDEPDPELWVAAVAALGACDTAEASDTLASIFPLSPMDDSEKEDASVIVRALTQEGHASGIDSLILILNDSSNPAELPVALFVALAAHPDNREVLTAFQDAHGVISDSEGEDALVRRSMIIDTFIGIRGIEFFPELVSIHDIEPNADLCAKIINRVAGSKEPEATSSLNEMYDKYREYGDVPNELWSALCDRIQDETARTNLLEAYQDIGEDLTELFDWLTSVFDNNTAPESLDMLLVSFIYFAQEEYVITDALLSALFRRTYNASVRDGLVDNFSVLSTEEQTSLAILCINEGSATSRSLLADCVATLDDPTDPIFEKLQNLGFAAVSVPASNTL